MDVENNIGQAKRGAEAIKVSSLDKLDGKITDDTAGAVACFRRKEQK